MFTAEPRRLSLRALVGASVGIGLSLAAFQASAADASKEHARRPIPETFQGPTVPAKAPKGIKVAIIVCSKALRGCTADGEFSRRGGEGDRMDSHHL